MSRKRRDDTQSAADALEAAAKAMQGMQSIAVSGTMSPPPATGRVTAMSPRHSTDREGTASTNPDMTIDRAFAQFEGWHLGIATKCLDIPHGAFGALCIAFSYFETVWQLTRGESSKGRSSEAFREGLLLVFPALDACSESDLKSLSEALYGGFRNSFFHNMIVGHSVAIAVYPWLLLMLRDGTPVLALSNDGAMFGTSELPDEYGVDARRYAGTQGDFICLNPHTFIPALVSHLGQFRTEIETGTDDGKDRFLRGYWGLLGARPEGQPN